MPLDDAGNTLPEVAFDDSGNTGSKLLDPEQPVFVLASVSLSRTQAEKILEGIRTDQTRELKFTKLKRNESGRQRILRVIASPELNSDNTKTYFVHKRFMVVSKIVDTLIVESLHYEAGFDAYEDGVNIALNNHHFHYMPIFCGQDWTETLLHRFVDMLRFHTPESVQRFYGAARTLYEISTSKEYAKLLLPLLASERISQRILSHSNKNSLDPAIPALFAHCVNWGEHFGGAFALVHDESKPIFQEKTTLEDFFSRGEEEHQIGYGPRSFVFPLRVSGGLRFARSEDDARLQVADLVAGASAKWASGFIPSQRSQDEDFSAAIGRSGIDRFLSGNREGGVWPISTPEQLRAIRAEHTGGTSAIDHITEFVSKHRKKP